MPQTAKFWDKIADRYAKSPIKDEATYQKKLEITRSYFNPETEILEFACGTGSTAIAHAPYVKHILAIDISSRMLEIAQQKAEAQGINNISFAHGTIEDFSEATHSFDVVMAHSILHLLDDPQVAINKSFSLLRPGGVFVSSTVCLGDSKVPWRIVIGLARLVRFAPFVNILARADLKAWLAGTGFAIEHESDPSKKMAAFIVARKPAS